MSAEKMSISEGMIDENGDDRQKALLGFINFVGERTRGLARMLGLTPAEYLAAMAATTCSTAEAMGARAELAATYERWAEILRDESHPIAFRAGSPVGHA